MKTAKQIQGDIISLLKGSELAGQISGKIYRGNPDDNYRPRDSRDEDLVVIFTTGTTDEIETGVVTINIYVPDVESQGLLRENGRRTAELEAAAAKWVRTLSCEKSDYLFKLTQTIYTESEPKINQHFVVVKLGYRYYGG